VLACNYPSGYKIPYGDNIETRKELLSTEGVTVSKNGVVADKRLFWNSFDMGEMVWGKINAMESE